MLDTAAFLFPAELEVVETKLRHVLIIGSCLSEAYVQHFRQHSPGTNYIHIMLNAAASNRNCISIVSLSSTIKLTSV